MNETAQIKATPIAKLSRDVRNAAKLLTRDEVRYLVKLYYQTQKMREASFAQARALRAEVVDASKKIKPAQPCECITFMGEQYLAMEKEAKSMLEAFSKNNPVCQWMNSIYGIGPVISVGLYSMIDISKCQTAGAIWRYAGLDPTVEWKAKEKRPWNGELKTLCWKLGESFVKSRNRDGDIYGHLYYERKQYELAKNEAGEYAAEAAKALLKKNFQKKEVIETYKSGKLTAGHIESRAKRYAVKMFLSHLFEVWYIMENHKEPPVPYAIGILGHAHKYDVPNFDKSLYLSKD
nr:MAG TPA: transposase-like protein [Caudoviricetes sp.]